VTARVTVQSARWLRDTYAFLWLGLREVFTMCCSIAIGGPDATTRNPRCPQKDLNRPRWCR